MKKYIFLTAVFVISCSIFFGYSSSAQAAATLTLGTTSGKAGDTVTIPVTMAGNSTITGANFDVVFDTNVLGSPTVAKSADMATKGFSLMSSKPSSNILRVVIINMETPTVIPNEVIANITFTINAGAVSGSSSVTLTAVAATDASSNTVTLTPANGSVSVTAVVKTYGLTDFIQLKNDWLQTKTSTADVNNDGTINTRDLGIMMSNWQG